MSGPRSHGLSPREQEIMDLHDAGGSSPAQIARRLGIATGTVSSVIRNYDFASCWSNSTAFERRARAASVRYVAACVASGGRYA